MKPITSLNDLAGKTIKKAEISKEDDYAVELLVLQFTDDSYAVFSGDGDSYGTYISLETTGCEDLEKKLNALEDKS